MGTRPPERSQEVQTGPRVCAGQRPAAIARATLSHHLDGFESRSGHRSDLRKRRLGRHGAVPTHPLLDARHVSMVHLMGTDVSPVATEPAFPQVRTVPRAGFETVQMVRQSRASDRRGSLTCANAWTRLDLL